MSGIESLKAYGKSPHHAWWGALTLGLGLATANPLLAVIGAAAYGLGWVIWPDSRVFQRWLTKRRQKQWAAGEEGGDADFAGRRKRMYDGLSEERRRRYDGVIGLAREIERSFREHAEGGGGMDVGAQLHRLDAMMWTYLRLLRTEQTLSEHLEGERGEELERRIVELRGEVSGLEGELAEMEASGKFGVVEGRRRLLDSHRERLEMLEKRHAKIAESETNLELAASEQSRVVGMLKLLDSELKTKEDAGHLWREIDEGGRQLGQMERWLSGLGESGGGGDGFPAVRGGGRVGYLGSSETLVEPGVQMERE